MGSNTSSSSAAARSFDRSTDPETREERIRVSYSRLDGALVEAITTAGERRVRSEIVVTTADGARERWVVDDDLKDDSKDAGRYVRERQGAVLEERGISPADYLAKRAELFRDTSAGVTWNPLGLTYKTSYTSAVVLAAGQDREGRPVYALASLGLHAGFPFPGEHWDEGQLAILHQDLRPITTLKMPAASEQTHLDLAFEELDGGARERILYWGYMEDEAGKLRFVRAEIVMEKKSVRPEDPSLTERFRRSINASVGFRQNAKILRDAGGAGTRLLIDGEPVMTAKDTIAALDDKATLEAAAHSKHLAINYAPPNAPLLCLISPSERTTRYRFDATVLADGEGVFHALVPAILRRGLTRANYLVSEDGVSREVEEELTVTEPPISSKTYWWELDGETVAVLRRDLVIARSASGIPELGFREVITKATS